MSLPAVRILMIWPLSASLLGVSWPTLSRKLPSSFDPRPRLRSIIWSAKRCTLSHASWNFFPPMSQYRSSSRNLLAIYSCAMLKALAKVCSPAVLGALRLFTDSPKRNAVVVSSVRRKKRGCKSTTPPPLMLSIKLLTDSRKTYRSSYCLCWKWGLSISRKCFQGAPS